MVLPILVLLLMGIMEWGWFFYRELNVVNTGRHAVRVGATTRPGFEESAGSCSGCEAAAESMAYTLLTNEGIDPEDATVVAQVVSIEGTCAIQVDISLTYDPITGFLPVPTSNVISVTQPLEWVDGC